MSALDWSQAGEREVKAALQGRKRSEAKGIVGGITGAERPFTRGEIRALVRAHPDSVSRLAAHPCLGETEVDGLLELLATDCTRAERQHEYMLLESAIQIAVRREVFSPSPRTLQRIEEVAARRSELGRGALLFYVERYRHARAFFPGEEREVLRRAYQERVEPEFDSGARAIVQHPQTGPKGVLRLRDAWDTRGLAEQVAGSVILEHSRLLEDVRVRAWMRTHRESPTVAQALALVSRPEDIEEALEVLHVFHLDRVLRDPRFTGEAIRWLSEARRQALLERLLGHSDPEVRLKGIRGAALPEDRRASEPSSGGLRTGRSR